MVEVKRKYRNYYILSACPRCGRERWISKYVEKYCGYLPMCHNCANATREGRHNRRVSTALTPNGYVLVGLHPDDFFYPMATSSGRVLEHRLVVAKALGRCLLPWEVVHHKGVKYTGIENRSDNRYPENLELLPAKKYHLVDMVSRNLIAKLQKRVTLLEAENIILQIEQDKRRVIND